MNNHPLVKLILSLVICFIFISAIAWIIVMIRTLPGMPSGTFQTGPAPTSAFQKGGIKQFNSDTELKTYLQNQNIQSGEAFFLGSRLDRSRSLAPNALKLPQAGGGEETSTQPYRVSQTNVQVLAVDEPDIVKTNGQELYISTNSQYYYTKPVESRVMPDTMGILPIPPERSAETKIIKAFPPKELAKVSTIDQVGNLLLSGKNLVVLGNTTIHGFDVSDTKLPKKSWKIDLVADQTQLVASRLYKDNLYLVTNTRVDLSQPCPLRPMVLEGTEMTIPCTTIYHPVLDVPVDSTYTVFIVNPIDGMIKNKVSFVGSSGSSVIYMSEHNLYVTYSYAGDIVSLSYNFFSENGRDLLPEATLTRLAKLRFYDISERSKLSELETILSSYRQSLTKDEQVRFENEMTNRAHDYFKLHKRETEKTGIAKIGLDDLHMDTLGEVPGKPLNQFSLDEYNDHLRIATTISSGWLFGISSESTNDVYILDKKLAPVGSLTDLGVTERIYSVRFIEDRGYVVTFRQTDPFYVLNLSDPSHPTLSGQLKIPGFSSYLHPVTTTMILGIGREGSQVKLSLFDVSTPSEPRELDKYTLSEYSSEVLENQHAFLLDKKHRIFFFPADKGGYVFSYEDNKLKLAKVVSTVAAQRAVYLDDYLYIIGDNRIAVFDERTWTQVGTLDL